MIPLVVSVLVAALSGAPPQLPRAAPAPSAEPVPPLLVVLAPAGAERNGLPVYTRHPNGAAYEALLGRGFSGRLLQLYRWEQQFLARRDGLAVEPAYLLLSSHEGGFPRFGFWLDASRKAGVGYVDLQARLADSGRFGALDQIFPHELMHVIVHQLAEPPPPGASGANQVHAIGVRTDRVTAFDEGFAEHAQVMAIDDPDAVPATRSLRTNASLLANADERLRRYHRALDAWWAPAPPARVDFVAWFSQMEQVLRYHAVKANRFARQASIRLARIGGADLYEAYLLDNILPGTDEGPFKSTPRLLATEGVVAALFSRWVMDPVMQQPATDALYTRFGIDAQDATPMQHAYLKLFTVFADSRPHDVAAVVTDYAAAFPAEADAIGALMRRTGFAWPLPGVPELWLANDAFMTGTTMFDQYRALPRVHTFDLNAASVVDLLTVPGVSIDLADAIQRRAPFASLDDLAAVPGVTGALMDRVRAMARQMAAVRAANATEDIESLSLARLFQPIIVRGVVWIGLCTVAAALLYRRVRVLQAWRLLANGGSAAVLGLVPAWTLGGALQVGNRPVESAWFVFLPVVVIGVPAAIRELSRRRPREAGRVIGAWAIACVPALVVTTPLF